METSTYKNKWPNFHTQIFDVSLLCTNGRVVESSKSGATQIAGLNSCHEQK